jgi:hypothetical protein
MLHVKIKLWAVSEGGLNLSICSIDLLLVLPRFLMLNLCFKDFGLLIDQIVKLIYPFESHAL